MPRVYKLKHGTCLTCDQPIKSNGGRYYFCDYSYYSEKNGQLQRTRGRQDGKVVKRQPPEFWRPMTADEFERMQE